MKRCPECRRDYYDETLNFCLGDGTPLGVRTAEPVTAILSAQSFGERTQVLPPLPTPSSVQAAEECAPAAYYLGLPRFDWFRDDSRFVTFAEYLGVPNWKQ